MKTQHWRFHRDWRTIAETGNNEITKLNPSHQLWQLVKLVFQMHKFRKDNEISFTLWVMQFEAQLNVMWIADDKSKWKKFVIILCRPCSFWCCYRCHYLESKCYLCKIKNFTKWEVLWNRNSWDDWLSKNNSIAINHAVKNLDECLRRYAKHFQLHDFPPLELLEEKWKVSVLGVFLVRIFTHLNWIRENTQWSI